MEIFAKIINGYPNPVDTGRKLNVRKMFGRLYVFWTSYVRSIYVLRLREIRLRHLSK